MVDFSEKGLPDVVDLLCEAMSTKIEQLNARIDQVEEEKASSLLEKIPECPVNIQFYFTKYPSMFYLLLLRFVLKSSRRTSPSSAARLDTLSVEPARPTRPSR